MVDLVMVVAMRTARLAAVSMAGVAAVSMVADTGERTELISCENMAGSTDCQPFCFLAPELERATLGF
jgi:hypothetical protein